MSLFYFHYIITLKTPLGNLTICRTIFPNQYVVNDAERQCKQNSRFPFLFLCESFSKKKKERRKKNVDDSEREERSITQREKREVCHSNLQKSRNFRLKRSISHVD